MQGNQQHTYDRRSQCFRRISPGTDHGNWTRACTGLERRGGIRGRWEKGRVQRKRSLWGWISTSTSPLLPAQRGCRPGHTSEGGQGELVALYVGYNIIIYQAIVLQFVDHFPQLVNFELATLTTILLWDLQILSKNSDATDCYPFYLIKIGAVLTNTSLSVTHLVDGYNWEWLCLWTNMCCLLYRPRWFLKKDLKKWHNISSGEKDRPHAYVEVPVLTPHYSFGLCCLQQYAIFARVSFYVPFNDV